MTAWPFTSTGAGQKPSLLFLKTFWLCVLIESDGMFLQQQMPLNISAQLDYNFFGVLSPGDTHVSITERSAVRAHNRKEFFSKMWHDYMYVLKLLRVRCFKSADVHIYFGKALNHKNIALEVVFKVCVHVYLFVCEILQLM